MGVCLATGPARRALEARRRRERDALRRSLQQSDDSMMEDEAPRKLLSNPCPPDSEVHPASPLCYLMPSAAR